MYYHAQWEITWVMSEENDKLHIRLRVCDTEIPVKVLRREEEVYRKAADLVTSTVNIYTNRAQGKRGTIELLHMALIDIALKYEKELQRNDTKPYRDILTTLTTEIEDALASKDWTDDDVSVVNIYI